MNPRITADGADHRRSRRRRGGKRHAPSSCEVVTDPDTMTGQVKTRTATVFILVHSSARSARSVRSASQKNRGQTPIQYELESDHSCSLVLTPIASPRLRVKRQLAGGVAAATMKGQEHWECHRGIQRHMHEITVVAAAVLQRERVVAGGSTGSSPDGFPVLSLQARTATSPAPIRSPLPR